ncbi:hypothetical protein [Pseudooceanicola sp. HF7]|uniref:hypothetical protein n=1 Tax=Pseudooceanicola sp. HF7 TaxID=2721560 RepID=UPI001431A5BD|nr:hypothetical protein [Pseudooceanicola sp. HF7]NIZ11627.1 hypothetical protein [Pseudooceanicola sp. HF7]
MKTHTKTITAALILGALAACTQAPVMRALEEPGYFIFRQEEGLIAGNYNPAGYEEAEIRDLIAIACKGDEIAEYSSGTGTDGLVVFTATCPQGPAYDKGIYEAERSDRSVRIEGMVPMDGALARVITEN